jgi:hypothetical protein
MGQFGKGIGGKGDPTTLLLHFYISLIGFFLFIILQQGSSALSERSMFGCYLVMDPDIPTSVNSALRYWGCTLQAGVQVSGATGICSSHLNEE